MKIKQSVFYLWILFGVLFSTPAVFGAEVRMYGISVEGGTVYASLQLDGKPTRWLREGDFIEGYAIIKIDPKGQSVTLLDRNGTPSKVSLSKAVEQSALGLSAAGVLIPLDQLNWEWIKSDANSMRKMRELLPEWAVRNWRTLSDNTKLALRNYYRTHGWDIVVTERGSGALHVSNTRLKDPHEPPPTAEELKKRRDTRIKINTLEHINNKNEK